jgi:hypothetical protein
LTETKPYIGAKPYRWNRALQIEASLTARLTGKDAPGAKKRSGAARRPRREGRAPCRRRSRWRAASLRKAARPESLDSRVKEDSDHAMAAGLCHDDCEGNSALHRGEEEGKDRKTKGLSELRQTMIIVLGVTRCNGREGRKVSAVRYVGPGTDDHDSLRMRMRPDPGL